MRVTAGTRTVPQSRHHERRRTEHSAKGRRRSKACHPDEQVLHLQSHPEGVRSRNKEGHGLGRTDRPAETARSLIGNHVLRRTLI